MSTIDLSQYGITGAKVIHNPSYDQLFIDEVKPELEGYEKGQETELGAVNVMTGIYTGRSPKDKFFVTITRPSLPRPGRPSSLSPTRSFLTRLSM